MHPELIRVTNHAAQLIIAESDDLGRHGLSQVAPQQPGLVMYLLAGRPQCNEQVSHASAIQAPGLVSLQVGSCKWVLCQERGHVPRYGLLPAKNVIIPARPASDDVHIRTQFKIRTSRFWCAASPSDLLSVPLKVHLCSQSHVVVAVHKEPQPSCLLCRQTHGDYAPCEKLFTSKSSRTANYKACPAPRVPYQHLLSRKPSSFGDPVYTLSQSTLQ